MDQDPCRWRLTEPEASASPQLNAELDAWIASGRVVLQDQLRQFLTARSRLDAVRLLQTVLGVLRNPEGRPPVPLLRHVYDLIGSQLLDLEDQYARETEQRGGSYLLLLLLLLPL